MADEHKSHHTANSPVVLLPLLLGVAIVFATLVWFAARREIAALYGIVRTIQFPIISSYMPHADHFALGELREGRVPSFLMIYENSILYGLFFTALILMLLILALRRLDRFSIIDHVSVKKEQGRKPEEIMAKLAEVEPSVRFFLDYDVLGLPTTEGTARQPLRAIELLLYTDTIRAVVLDPELRRPPELEIDRQRLEAWMTEKFGRTNPFVEQSKRRLMDRAEIEQAVDELSWYAVLVLYPALRRIHGFYVEDSKGYKTVQQDIENFINGIWTELNGFKKEFRDGISLGYANDADREERNALYKAGRAKVKKKGAKALKQGRKDAAEALQYTADPSAAIDNLTDLARAYRRGRVDRGEIATEALIERSEAGPQKKAKPVPPENLMFFGEVLSERGPKLKHVEQARNDLKDLLTRHLGSQRRSYPVGTDPKTGMVRYETKISSAEEKAFNSKAQERLASAVQAIEGVLFNHQYEFSVVGGALDRARRYGIMPPNLFRWLRFCDETTPFWWFVQNLGMPAAYPENAAHFEHYQAEKVIGVAIERPHVSASIDGIRMEAMRYLVPETVEELRSILGRAAISQQIVEKDFASQLSGIAAEAARGVSGKPPAGSVSRGAEATTYIRRPQQAGAKDAPSEALAAAPKRSIIDVFDLDDDDDDLSQPSEGDRK